MSSELFSSTDPIQTSSAAVSAASFDAILQHWAKSRIDAPLHVISRYDEAAKQLVVVGGILQGVFTAILVIGGIKEHPPILITLAFFAPLIIQVFCAAKVICTVPLKMEAFETYQLLLETSHAGKDDYAPLTCAIENWCATVDKLAERKHHWLFAANVSLLLNALTATFLLGMITRAH
jgi:hypothetical protein